MKGRGLSPGELFRQMLLIGLVGFGGGSALIPLFERTIRKSGMVSREEFDRDVVVANLTPGALPVEIASGLGRQTLGPGGMIVAACGMTVPGVVLTVLLLAVFSVVPENLLVQFRYLSLGVSAGIMGILFRYVGRVWHGDGKGDGTLQPKVMAVSLAAFLLACGKNVRKLFGIGGSPVFGWSTLQILAAAFAVLILRSLMNRKQRGAGGSLPPARTFLRELLVNMLTWGVFLLLASLPAFLLVQHRIGFQAKGFLSSLLSFGGGDAYLTVAHGLFVESGMVTEDYFYTQLVPVTNVLPGSILCKMLGGCGYIIGFQENGLVWQGVLMAISGAAVGVAASGITFHTADVFYGAVEHLQVFHAVSRWIRPIIAGLLLNIALSLLAQIVSCSQILGCEPMVMWLLAGFFLLVFRYLSRRRRWKDGAILALFAAAGILAGNWIIWLWK